MSFITFLKRSSVNTSTVFSVPVKRVKKGKNPKILCNINQKLPSIYATTSHRITCVACVSGFGRHPTKKIAHKSWEPKKIFIDWTFFGAFIRRKENSHYKSINDVNSKTNSCPAKTKDSMKEILESYKSSDHQSCKWSKLLLKHH